MVTHCSKGEKVTSTLTAALAPGCPSALVGVGSCVQAASVQASSTLGVCDALRSGQVVAPVIAGQGG